MKTHLPRMGKFTKRILILTTTLVLCIIQLSKYQDSDVISQVLSLEYVNSVDDWPYGIKFARYSTEKDSPVDWKWLKILDKLLIPGCNIVDIGANDGDTALILAVAAKGGTVVAFEMGTAIDMLRVNKRLNAHLKIDIHHYAVSNTTGTVHYENNKKNIFGDSSGTEEITSNTSSQYEVSSVRLYPFLLEYYGKEFVDNICMVKIDTEGHDAVILSDMDPKFRPRVLWVEWYLLYQFYDWDNAILEDDDWCTQGSASLFDIPHSLGYQVFSPSMPLRRVPGCQTKHFVSDLLLLKNEFVKTIGDKLDNEPEIHLEGERIGPPKF